MRHSRHSRFLWLGTNLPTCFWELRDETRTGQECGRQDTCTLHTLILISCCLNDNTNQALRKRFQRKCQEGKVVPHEISYLYYSRVRLNSWKGGNFLQRKENYYFCYLKLLFSLYFVRITFWEICKRINLFWAINPPPHLQVHHSF